MNTKNIIVKSSGFGYEISTIIISQELLNTVPYIFNAYELLRSLSAVTNLLNYKKFRSPKGTSWIITNVRSILTNPCYYKTKNFPNMISSTQFEKCQHILSEQALGRSRTHLYTVPHVFSGLLYCTNCGKPMGARANKKSKFGRYPANYSCAGKRAHTCDSRYLGEYLIGEFMFNLLITLCDIIRTPPSLINIQTVEQAILKHKFFPEINHIEAKGLLEFTNRATAKTIHLFH